MRLRSVAREPLLPLPAWAKALWRQPTSTLAAASSSNAPARAMTPANTSTKASTADAVVLRTARARSDSQSSTRPYVGPAPASGLGIVTPVDNVEDVDADVHPSSPLRPIPIPSHRRVSEQRDPFTQDSSASASPSRPISPGSNENGKQALRPPPQPRSSSPSKSIRSLQKHLDRGESAAGQPRKMSSSQVLVSPAKQGGSSGAKPGWESLWSAEYSLESPGKGKK
jgi:autophagy-related protein 11